MAEATARTHMQLRGDNGRFARGTDRAARRIARRLAEEAAKEARRILEPHRSGRGGPSMVDAIEVEDHGKVCYVVNTHPGGHAMEKGQAAHEIPGGLGHEGGVMHPGAQPVPHIKPGSEAAYRQRRKIVGQEVRRAGL